MSLGVAMGSITVLLMGIFLGIVVWTYGVKRESDFKDIANPVSYTHLTLPTSDLV